MEDGGYLSYFPYFCTDYWRAGIHAGPFGLLAKVMERKHLILLIIWAWLLPCAHGQNVLPYKTQTIDGVEYYIYPVKRSEGLYRISVNFGVTQEEISQAKAAGADVYVTGDMKYHDAQQAVEMGLPMVDIPELVARLGLKPGQTIGNYVKLDSAACESIYTIAYTYRHKRTLVSAVRTPTSTAS